MYFRVLGPVEVWERERRFSAGPLKEQCILAILLLESGRVVSAQSLAERLWDDRLPDRARETLHVYVSRLRARLRAAGDEVGVIGRSPAGGYRLDVSADQVDARLFDSLVTQARAAASKPDPARAHELLRQAEALWNGDPLEGLSGQWAEATRLALKERHRGAVLARMELDLRLGRASEELVSELTALTGVGRIDQRLTGLLMRALHAAGRQDEALALFRSVRERLRGELGVDPGDQLETLHRRILRGDSLASAGPDDAGVAPHTLDRDPLYLTDRDEQLQEILEAVTADLRSPSGIAVHVLNGMAGIGKTALALRAAHQLAEHCPDGVLQVSLRTHDPHEPAVDTRVALIHLLEATGVNVNEIGHAHSLDALAALWRRRNSRRRILLLLDDAPNADQIRALLPVSVGSIVLITSRRRLVGLHAARHHAVPPLSEGAVIELLTRITGQHFAGQREASERFARRCAGLPLAVTVAAAFLRARPTWTLADLVERMESQVHSTIDDQLNGPVYTAFVMSYRALSPPAQALLQRAAAQPGPEFGLLAASALADVPPEDVDFALDTLIDHHLLEETSRHRYRLHSLLRDFAASQAHRDGALAATKTAIDRMIGFYTVTAAHAEHILRPHRRIASCLAASQPLPDPGVQDPDTAQRWLDRETVNLTAVAAYALSMSTAHARILPCLLAQHLDRRGLWRESVDLLSGALEASIGVADTLTAQLQTDLAEAFLRAGEPDRALSHALTALDAWDSHGDQRGQADALLEIGRIHWHARHSGEATAALEHSSQIYQQVGHLRGQAVADYHRGIVLFESGKHDDALALTHDALRTASALGISALECDTLTNLGEMYRLIGRHQQALEFFQRARHIADRQGDPHNIAVLANNIAAVHDHRGDHQAALDSCTTALRLFQALGDRRNEIDTLVQMAEALRHARDYDAAASRLERAAKLAELVQDPLRSARISLAEGHLRRTRGLHRLAVACFETALAHAEQASAPLDQAQAHQALADTLAGLGDEPGARRHREAAEHLNLAPRQRDSGH